MIQIALDLAKSAGIAWITDDDPNTIHVRTVVGDPVYQLYSVLDIAGNHEKTVVYEMLTSFRNAQTTRSLAERIGYIYWRLVELSESAEDDPKPMRVMSIRKKLGFKSKAAVKAYFSKMCKGITDDEADAAALLCAYFDYNPKGFKYIKEKKWVQ